MPTPQRLPIVNSDDGIWGDILRQYLMKEHYNDDTDNAVNGGHKTITVRAGTTCAGTAPIKLTSGSLMTTPEAGAIEFLTDALYFTQTTVHYPQDNRRLRRCHRRYRRHLLPQQHRLLYVGLLSAAATARS